MPKVLDYEPMIESLGNKGIKSLYYNGGTFGFIDEASTRFVGWASGDDATLRAEFRARAVHVDVAKMPELIRRVWKDGPIWFTPGSHWAYEIEDGGADYMPALLREIGIDPVELGKMNRGNAIEFASSDAAQFENLVARLLTKERITDYGLLLPDAGIIGLLHHHQQIWWRVREAEQEDLLRTIPSSCNE